MCTIVWDNSDATSFDTKKKNFFFGKRTNLQVAMEYCTLSYVETEECRSELDESDLMMMEDFQKIFNFYTMEKTFHVQDDWLFMDIFNFFVSRDLDLEATILAEKVLGVPSIVEVENIVIEEDITRTMDAEEAMDIGVESLPDFTLSKAEIFYLECQVKNPKDAWSEFTFVVYDNFDFSKIATC